MFISLPKRSLLLSIILIGSLICIYYVWSPPPSKATKMTKSDDANIKTDISFGLNVSQDNFVSGFSTEGLSICPNLPLRKASIETCDVYPSLNFNANWIERREYWNDKMERRYRHRRKELWPKLPLKVIIMPHSHNDPGWLKTYEGYFHQSTQKILSNAVSKMTKYRNMTFVWTEMSYLHLWWESAQQAEKEALKKLVDEGRFEILTGGWVMTDEANVHLFAMVDQLVEGHHWLLSHLGVRPKSSWSVDPFGHGGTFPYLLKASDIDGMVIMRIHYAWKEYFAIHQNGDFLWQQRWDTSDDSSILCHNFPYDIYSVKGSCGPHAQTCVQYNFAVAPGSGYSEYAARMVPINPSNVRERAEKILEEYGRTGSLFPHNVVLVPLGDDFTYSHEVEWDQQYANYKMLIDYINAHFDEYHAQVRFGTLSDYFKEVRSRTSDFETLSGDFFVYSDIFSEGVPAYWSGYFTTRPFFKQLSRELEHNLRAAEILFTISYQGARQRSESEAVTHFRNDYFDLIQARRNLALFQHHDAITGTSKQFVMHDYGVKLFDGLIKSRGIQRTAIQYLLEKTAGVASTFDRQMMTSDYERPEFTSPPKPITLDLRSGDQFIVVFNALANAKFEAVSFFVDRQNKKSICVVDPAGNFVKYQVTPTWSVANFFRLDTSVVEIVFEAKLEPLSINKYKVFYCDHIQPKIEVTKVYCTKCRSAVDDALLVEEPLPDGSIVLENSALTLTFDEDTKLLSTITHKATGRVEKIQVTFGAYSTMQFRSGAYLFKTNSQRPEMTQVFDQGAIQEVVVVSGPVFSEISVVYEGPKTSSFVHLVRLFHTTKGSAMASGVYMENNFDFGDAENFRDLDLFMRVKSGIRNAGNKGPPSFYSDQNGFQMQRRVKASNISIEGNYFPITTMTYIEDEKSRISLIVDHAQGAASWQEGWLEIMVDRRSSYDDARGMGEGVLDSRSTSHKYWLLFEPQSNSVESSSSAGQSKVNDGSSLPSALAHQLSRYLNYPSIQYVGNVADHDSTLASRLELLNPQAYPCDLHLLNLKTLPSLSAPNLPSNEGLLILHNQTPDCSLNDDEPLAGCFMSPTSSAEDLLNFKPNLRIKDFEVTSLTGTRPVGEPSSKISFKIVPMALQAIKIQF